MKEKKSNNEFPFLSSGIHEHDFEIQNFVVK